MSSPSYHQHSCGLLEDSEEIPKDQFTRLVIQAIQSLGYPSVSKQLEEQSGLCALNGQVAEFCECIFSGEWSRAAQHVSHLGLEDVQALDKVRFLIYEQQYLETLENGEVESALHCLRSQVTPLCSDMKRLQRLTSLVMCKSSEDLRKQCAWNTTGPSRRRQLLEEIQRYIPPWILPPQRRLQGLVKQALEAQKKQSFYPYCTPPQPSLLEDLKYCPEKVPHLAYATLRGHKDEVWFVAFSHSGRYLASLSKDRIVLIWRLDCLDKYSDEQVSFAAEQLIDSTVQSMPSHLTETLDSGYTNGLVHSVNGEQPESNTGRMDHSVKGYIEGERVVWLLNGHEDDITFLAWSPDDCYLATCSNDHTVLVWEVFSGQCKWKLSDHKEIVSSCAWLSNGCRLVTSGPDEYIYEYDLLSEHPTSPVCFYRSKKTADLVVTPDDSKIIAVAERYIQIFDRSTQLEVASLLEIASITSLSLSKDGNYLLVNMSMRSASNYSDGEAEIHLWDLTKRKVIQDYRGQRQINFVIRSTFGGQGEVFVVSGSEDTSVYIWFRDSGDLVYRLDGHHATVSCVDWNPKDPFLFASASDDHSIILWSNRERLDQRQPQHG
ncbi:transducin family protein / WD-40 repeat family protein [Galdieria sulphuraria]|uniref:Transducin family protein / WD-40 repeat family protein n=1 Tax=Galdieria sulphuraria TaxID=130081 RepID=M2XM04_GALSU|nr:transducin family protein / WD-40 repeat family protein [Galdieria sulphuraria]EME31227.1 transducin family protein / WD-40 repeat family protein [Galdieria sulphuraria]|eukprot:XP_005707747.1 transducin family protein / WD-40 repeat family protein [Galdieria sulphuraria]